MLSSYWSDCCAYWFIVRTMCKIIIIHLYFRKFKFQLTLISFWLVTISSFPWRFKHTLLIYGVLLVRNCKWYCAFLRSLIIEYLVSISFVSRKSCIGVISTVTLSKTLPQLNQQTLVKNTRLLIVEPPPPSSFTNWWWHSICKYILNDFINYIYNNFLRVCWHFTWRIINQT